MDLSTLLAPTSVRFLQGISSKKRLFQEVGEVLSKSHDLPSGAAFDALQERESLGPTGVGHGIALPHARVAGMKDVCGVFARLDKPLEFEAVDRMPVDLVFALLAPEDAGVDHLKALALVSRTMRDSGLCAKLRANEDPATLYALLVGNETTRAA